MKILQKIISLIFVLIAINIYTPCIVSADYSMNGRNFDSYNEFKAYIVEYMAVWREIHSHKDVIAEQKIIEIKTSNSDKAKLEITTGLATDINYDRARLIGKINFKSSERVRIWFKYGGSPNYLSLKTESEVLDEDDGTRRFDRNLRNLRHNTKYYYQAIGLNEDNIYSHGKIRSFRTGVDARSDDALIKVSTRRASDIDEDRATLTGNINFRDELYAYTWFEYGDEEKYLDNNTSKKIVYKKDGKITSRILHRLESEEYYFYRIVAQDKAGAKSYGKTIRFKTRRNIVNEKPKVTTSRPKNIGLYIVTLVGSVDMNDFRNGIAFFIYGENKEDVDEIKKRYKRYRRIREYGDDRKKLLLDDDIDRYKLFEKKVSYLDLDTKHYYAIGVEYENEDDDEVIIMGRTYPFTTKDLN